LLAATRRPALAALSHRRALAFEPRNASAHANLGLVLVTLKRTAQALAHQQRAHELAPDHPQIRSNLGNALARLGRDDEAEPHLREAVRLDPSAASSHLNLGVWLCDQGHEQEAEQRLRDAVALRPNYALARLDLSCLLLAQGRFDEGWRLHEARHDPALPDNGISGPNVGLAVWNGEPLHGKAVLIWPEQGLGDQIQFCRFALALKALGARRITLVCQQPLQTLFETLPGVDRVVAARIEDNAFHVEPQALGEHDYWVFPLSLPLRLRTQLSDLPGTPIPYLQAEPGRVARWRQRLHDDAAAHPGAMRVGLVWRGNPAHNNDAQRSMPGLKTLAALWTVPGVRFVSLQTGAAAAQAQAMAAAQPLLALGHELLDFADTAAVLKTLDLLICVDTSIAHLAGALATPCWVMLPHRKTDWRWLKGREDSPWYPNGMRLFRQAERGAWGGVVQRVAHALRQRVSPTSGHGAAP
jgi:Tfp pilus assembly protein PilF